MNAHSTRIDRRALFAGQCAMPHHLRRALDVARCCGHDDYAVYASGPA